jgi:glycosyltransferase involved in cell wall biosynthesis
MKNVGNSSGEGICAKDSQDVRVRILTAGNLYPPHHLGGYELLWQAAVRHLRAAGHEVRVLCTDHREDGAGAEDDPDVHRDLRWYWRDHDWPRISPLAVWRLERHNARTWQRHVEDFSPDAVSWWAMGGMSLSLVRDNPLPASGWIIDDWLVYAPHVDKATKLLRRTVDWPRAARWVFCAEGVRQAAADARGELGETVVEPLGVAPEFTEHPDQPWQQRLLYVGRIDERKGIATAVEALAHLPEATLRIVGGGDPREADRLRELAAAAGVAERVSFDGAVPRAELADVYASGDVTLFPVTWPEPFGLVPLEAMAVGRPVIATGRGGSGDYLRDRDNTLLFEAGDARGLAACVERLADPALRAQLRAGGLRTAGELTESRWLAAVLREHQRLA